MTPPIRMVSVPSEPLWMMHVLGPDDIYPAPDHETAVEWCAYLNSKITQKATDVLCVAVPAVWTGTAEEHAEGLPEAIKGWTHTFTAAPVREEGGAVRDAVKIATDLHHAYEQLIYGLPKYLEAENLTDEENMIREAWITLDVTAHRLAALAPREEAPAEVGEASLVGNAGDADCPTCQGSGLMRVEIGLHSPDATVETHPCDRCPGLNGARVRLANMARDIDMGLTPLAAWPYQLSNPTSATAKATAYDIGLVLSALRAQPQARSGEGQ